MMKSSKIIPPLSKSLLTILFLATFAVAATVFANVGSAPVTPSRVPPETRGLVDRVNELYRPGMVIAYAGTVAPDGWVICDGRLLDPANPTHLRLMTVIQDTYNLPQDAEGSSRLPDLRGRVVIGAGKGYGQDTQGHELTEREVGERLGAEKHQLTMDEMPKHNHGQETGPAGAHQHDVINNHGSIVWGDDGGNSRTIIDAGKNASRSGGNVRTNRAGNHTHSISAEGGDQPHNIMQPSLVMNYIIKL